jgi:lysyl-tRNA synthetase class 2
MPENTQKDPELLREDIIRLNHLETLHEAKIEPYPAQSSHTHTLNEAIEAGEGTKVMVVGRLVAFRDMGKLAFGHLQDDSGKLQIAISEKELTKEDYKFFVKNFDLGDFVQVEGEMFTTHKGEVSVLVKKYTLLAKALLPMPEKWHGLQNIELRYRQRYLDLMSNVESMRIAKLRSVLVKELRNFFDAKGFYEVETPILQPLYGMLPNNKLRPLMMKRLTITD